MNGIHNRVNGKTETEGPQTEPPTGIPGNSEFNDPRARTSATAPDQSPLDPLKVDLAEMATAAVHYLIATRDLAVARVRHIVLWLIVGVGILCVSLAAAVTAVVLILQGIALAVAEAFDGRLWAGQLLTGAVVLGIFVATAGVVFRGSNRNWHQRVMAKYDYYKQRERAAFERRNHRATDSQTAERVQP